MNVLRRAAGVVCLAAVIAAGVLTYTHRQQLYDWYRLRHYQAPATISQLATDDTMTPEARHIFYVNHPDLTADKNSFNQRCTVKEQAVVLGCYHSNQQGIYLYAVSDPQLDGVEQVTAAHEMLHAAYDRLSESERNKVDALLQNYYNTEVHDPQIINEINLYKKTEPNDVVNEMHSVFGTEIANLPAPLENYYKQYFTNRQKIAQYAAAYQSAFTSRQQQVSADDAQLATMKSQIDTEQSALQQRQQSLATQKAQLEAENNSSTIFAYNTSVDAYNAAVDTYNAQVTALKNLINQYNALVDRRNAIAIQENQLGQEINSQATTAPTQQ